MRILALAVLLVDTVQATNSSCKITSLGNGTLSRLSPVLEKYQALLLMFLGFGGLSITLGVIYSTVRRYVYRDTNSLDTVFDAGGKVTVSLTAVTVTSQLLWPADFLQSATVMTKTGLGGSLFFALAIVLDILLFPLLSLTLKSRAPGAKTFLQIIYARYGKPAHIVFCCIALIANLVTLMGLVLAAKAALDVLANDVSDEMILLLLAFLFGSYCLIGGLGTTFYISYFTTALTFVSVLVFIVHVTYIVPDDKYTSQENVYEAMTCLKGPEGNYNNSYMTFQSRGGIIYGVLLFLMATSLSFCDQANWQSRIAAKPAQGVAGFFLASYLWFAIPLTITIASSSIYLSMSYQNGTNLLSTADIDSGFITPYVMETVMGETGAYMLITMVTMSLMSTGSGEVMAISSIIVYDIYKVYINPFNDESDITRCPLCRNNRIRSDNRNQTGICRCPIATSCKLCFQDIAGSLSSARYAKPYECAVHGSYRRYEDQLLHYKSWCMIWVTISIIPYGLIIINSGVNLNWAVFTLQGLLSAFLCPLVLTITWPKCTGKGVISGSVCGGICYFVGLLVVTELVYETGLRDFLVNSSKDYSLLGGMISGVTVSVSLTVIVSLCTNNIKSAKDAEKIWDRTMSIDNPLSPWRRLYHDELVRIHVGEDEAVTTKHMVKIFRNARFLAIFGGLFSLCVFGIVIPSSVLTMDILSSSQYNTWVTVCQVWVMIAAAFAILVPPVEEVAKIIKDYRDSKQKKHKYIKKSQDKTNIGDYKF